LLDLSSLENAIEIMSKIVQRSEDDSFMSQQDDITRNAIQSGVIQHFEIVYELCWKFIQRWIKLNQSSDEVDNVRTRKELFRIAARMGLIEDPKVWFSYGDARNLTSHIYDENKANEVYSIARSLVNDADKLLGVLTKYND
jgi:nucleotidyltransferase substrate binding protein (TIGR01987 family)